jgi:hypothetical protein
MIKGYKKHAECIVCKDTNVKAKALCNKHYTKAMRYNLLHEEDEIIIKRFNEIESEECYICGNEVAHRGLCKKHHRIATSQGVLKRTREDITSIIKEYESRKTCYICGRKTRARGLCHACYIKADYKGVLDCDKEIIREEFKINLRSKNKGD